MYTNAHNFFSIFFKMFWKWALVDAKAGFPGCSRYDLPMLWPILRIRHWKAQKTHRNAQIVLFVPLLYNSNLFYKIHSSIVAIAMRVLKLWLLLSLISVTHIHLNDNLFKLFHKTTLYFFIILWSKENDKNDEMKIWFTFIIKYSTHILM